MSQLLDRLRKSRLADHRHFNQGGIALGFIDMRTCSQAMAETQYQVHHAFGRSAGARITPDAKGPGVNRCWCRKPGRV